MPTATSIPPAAPRTLLDELLDQERSLSAVEQFARRHERAELEAASRYRALLPAAPPAPGQQYAFEVDLDKCSGCKACVTACHALNGLEDNEAWRSVGLLMNRPLPRRHLGPPAPALLQHVTTACHHCVDPGCLNGCPVLAYDKDPVTGIVRHLDDQCIGCQYCVMKCPYDVPKYSSRLGIVRKCDLCQGRLAAGEAPACVQACPNEAIRISVVEVDAIRTEYRVDDRTFAAAGQTAVSSTFLAATPNPAITLPTTRFVSARSLPADLIPADDAIVRPARAHLPLTFMLVLTQLGVGLTLATALSSGAANAVTLSVALSAIALGLGAGTAHLGQPFKAWRAFLGWRRSWLSREMLAFGAFIGVLALTATAAFVPAAAQFLPALTAFSAVLGLGAVVTSAMIYADTARPFWRAAVTVPKFLLTVLALGAAGGLLLASSGRLPLSVAPWLAVFALGLSAKLAMECAVLRHLRELSATPLQRSARLLCGELADLFKARLLMAVAAIAIAGAVWIEPAFHHIWSLGLMTVMALVGEVIERHLFFVAEAAPGMPGGVSA